MRVALVCLMLCVGVSTAAAQTFTPGCRQSANGIIAQCPSNFSTPGSAGRLLIDKVTGWQALAACASPGSVLQCAGAADPAWAKLNTVALQANLLVYQTIIGNANGGLILGGSCFLTSPGVACSGTEQYLGIADRFSTARNLRCRADSPPGGARVSTFTVRQNGVDTALTCTMTGGASQCSDITHTISVTTFDIFSISDAEQLLSGLVRPVCQFVLTN